MSRASLKRTGKSNTPSIKSAATALSDSPERFGWAIQNLGQNPLFVRLGSGATTSVFHYVLKAGTANDDGLGGLLEQMGPCVYTGVITIAGTDPRYTVTEL
jgi:hypothetical protein